MSLLNPTTEESYGLNLYSQILKARAEAPVDIFGLLTDIGIAVTAEGLNPALAGWIEHRGRYDSWSIHYNREHQMSRIRWTLAHLLGHYVLHRDLMMGPTKVQGCNETTTSTEQTDDLPFRNPLITRGYESQANRFATDLLYPAIPIRSMLVDGLTVYQIADRLQTSVNATTIRIEQLRHR